MLMKKLKHHVRKHHAKFDWLSPWYILVLALIFGTISVLSLRQNNLTMIKLRDQVFTADKDNGDVEAALRHLRQYVYAHMNTNLKTGTSVTPPIQLKYTYERLAKAQQSKDKLRVNQIYEAAQRFCVARHAYSTGSARLNCVENYVNSRGGGDSNIPDSLYKFDFVSPTWTPDLAGITMAITFVLLIIFAVKLGLDLWVKHELGNQM